MGQCLLGTTHHNPILLFSISLSHFSSRDALAADQMTTTPTKTGRMRKKNLEILHRHVISARNHVAHVVN